MRKTRLHEIRAFRTAAAAVFTVSMLAMSFLAALRLDAQQSAPETELPPAAPLVDSLPEVVARVDDHPITKVQLLRQADSMRLQALQAGAVDPVHQGKQFLELVLDALIGEYLVYVDSQSRGITASDAEIDQQMEQMAAAHADEETFDRALAAQGLDRSSLRDEIRQQLSIDKLFDQEIEAAVQPTEEALRAFFDENSARWRYPPRVRARHILKQVSEGETEEALRAELLELRRRIAEGGAEFGELAVSASEDANTRDLGGDMGWIQVTGREGSIGQLLDGLETGEVSDVVQTQMGLHVFQVMERQPARPATFEEAREEVSGSYALVRVHREVQRRVAELKAKAKIEILM